MLDTCSRRILYIWCTWPAYEGIQTLKGTMSTIWPGILLEFVQNWKTISQRETFRERPNLWTRVASYWAFVKGVVCPKKVPNVRDLFGFGLRFWSISALNTAFHTSDEDRPSPHTSQLSCPCLPHLCCPQSGSFSPVYQLSTISLVIRPLVPFSPVQVLFGETLSGKEHFKLGKKKLSSK